MKTILIYGMIVKQGGQKDRDYQDPDTLPKPGKPTLVYYVEDSITPDDVMYYLHQNSVRVAKVDRQFNKTVGIIGVDTDSKQHKGQKILNRVGLSKAIKKDLKQISYKHPKYED